MSFVVTIKPLPLRGENTVAGGPPKNRTWEQENHERIERHEKGECVNTSARQTWNEQPCRLPSGSCQQDSGHTTFPGRLCKRNVSAWYGSETSISGSPAPAHRAGPIPKITFRVLRAFRGDHQALPQRGENTGVDGLRTAQPGNRRTTKESKNTKKENALILACAELGTSNHADSLGQLPARFQTHYLSRSTALAERQRLVWLRNELIKPARTCLSCWANTENIFSCPSCFSW